ncbi:SAICAR synthase-like protein [Diplogelasinospora grovesii]|uniref:1-phosphatidylinositol-4-phosphate 5-kinase n=1 Tax=Diplogelasinospora grovesii TaxID=303347 RepID=A0AAN6N8S0_9PEZI|nr:SAICAR synthase-like protein [Diplogelasinospora grovesii]
MPSFLATDENSPIHSQRSESEILHLDPAAEYGLSHQKVNGHISPQPQQFHKPSNESFDENSSQSTHTSEASSADTRPPADGDISRASSMNTMSNRVSGGGVDRAVSQKRESVSRKPFPNGNSIKLVDRTVRPPSASTNGLQDGDFSVPSPKDAPPRSSFGSVAAASIQQSPVEMYLQPVNKGDIRTVENGGPTLPPIPSLSGMSGFPSASSPALARPPGTPGAAESGRQQQSPHRFSSPPLYNSPATSPSSSGALPPPPPGAGLKHRHTLEVPKLTPGRGSRDGVDNNTGYSSGRFSPTAGMGGGRRASLSLARRNTQSIHSNLPRDEIVPDEDALRWAEAYRQKRASKRRKKEFEDDDRVLVGTKVDEKHANWVTAYNMLTGIRVAVSRTNAKLDRPLTDADFVAKQKSTFDIAGNELVPSAKYDFKFKDYAPWVFRHLRALFRLDPADYLMSLTGKYILSELGSPGKSGSFFYFSRDYKYIIKTIHHSEHKFLRKILKDYYQHVTDNPNTLLSQFYGLHRVKMPYGKKIHFVVMNNLFPPHRDIHQTFDLKGSTIGRYYKEDDLEKNPRATLKDLNWLRRQRHLELGLQKKQLFLEQLHKDVRLLQRLQIMDYSLLVGIHDVQKGNEENLRDKTLRVFNPGGMPDVPEDFDPHSVLMRTPSKLENQRKARELRQMIKSERPVPMGETSSRMPNELEEGQNRPGFVFNQDDGGFRATHEDNAPGDEIYYLGVIDCLTHYGIIKKLEHFWKGLSSDRHQISALPPQEYGERFINFISGLTMSAEEAHRLAQEKDAAMAAEAAAEEERQRAGNVPGTGRRRSSTINIPAMPTHQPPPVPTLPRSSSGVRSPEQEHVISMAELEARKSEMRGASEDDVPDRTIRAPINGPSTPGSLTPGIVKHSSHGSGSSQAPESRSREMLHVNQTQTVLPVVEEAAEGASSTGGDRSRNSHMSSSAAGTDSLRLLTPAKDGEEMHAGFGNLLIGRHSSLSKSHGPPPPTPPKTGYGGTYLLKPESADSGYGVTGAAVANASNGLKSVTGSQKSAKVRSSISRDSLDKALPPLPPLDGKTASLAQGVS